MTTSLSEIMKNYYKDNIFKPEDYISVVKIPILKENKKFYSYKLYLDEIIDHEIFKFKDYENPDSEYYPLNNYYLHINGSYQYQVLKNFQICFIPILIKDKLYFNIELKLTFGDQTYIYGDYYKGYLKKNKNSKWFYRDKKPFRSLLEDNNGCYLCMDEEEMLSFLNKYKNKNFYDNKMNPIIFH